MEKRNRRIFMSAAGVLTCGVSVGFFKRAAFGVDPFQTLMNGLFMVIPVNFGLLYVIVNICLLMFSVCNDRKKIGIGTFINLFLLGYVIDFSEKTLRMLIPEAGLSARIILLLIGIVVMCLSSSFYFTAALGVSTYDAISLIVSEKWKPAPFKYCRIASDLVCVVTGSVLFFAAKGSLKGLTEIAGAGTVITAFFMGPLIDFFNVHLARPFLDHSSHPAGK